MNLEKWTTKEDKGGVEAELTFLESKVAKGEVLTQSEKDRLEILKETQVAKATPEKVTKIEAESK